MTYSPPESTQGLLFGKAKPDPRRPLFLAEVPSNIAFLKYWGKLDEKKQWPANDSLSMTLTNAKTQTWVQMSDDAIDKVYLDDCLLCPEDPQAKKIYAHLKRLRELSGSHSPHLVVFTHNTFPKACGIASSASGLGALTLGAIGALHQAHSLADLENKGFDRTRLAGLARLGSGSAGRSFWGGYVVWEKGENADAQRIFPLAIPQSFQLADLIVMISKQEKQVSSSEGHRMAWSSPLFTPRLAIHPHRCEVMSKALSCGDLERAGDLMETEALDMHAVMMTATPAANYLTEKSLRLISWIRQERRKSGLPAWFTIDAGPNIHVICRLEDQKQVLHALVNQFDHSEPLDVLADQTGFGPQLTQLELE